MNAQQFERFTHRDANYLLYFGANAKDFKVALQVIRGNSEAIVANAAHELKDYRQMPQYTIEVRGGKFKGWNVINSEKFYGERYWEGQSKVGLPVLDFSHQKAVIL